MFQRLNEWCVKTYFEMSYLKPREDDFDLLGKI